MSDSTLSSPISFIMDIGLGVHIGQSAISEMLKLIAVNLLFFHNVNILMLGSV
jgi:hypothetical protein